MGYQRGGIVDDQQLQALVDQLDGLPSAPKAWTELTHHLAHPATASVRAIATIIERDVALMAQVLRQANSSVIRRGRAISSVRDAIVRLGFGELQQLVLNAETGRLFASASAGGVSVEALCDQGLARGVLASHLVTDVGDGDAAFVGAMMLEVGQLVAACFLPDQTAQIRRLAHDRGWALHEAEAEVWGVTHADLGAYLLRSWQLPEAVADAVADHHTDLEDRGGPIDPATAARLARALLGTTDPLDPVDLVTGWDDAVDKVTALGIPFVLEASPRPQGAPLPREPFTRFG